MGMDLRALWGALALGVCALPAGAGDVNDARLVGAAGDEANWLTYGRDYANQRFSKLSQIDRTSIARLAPRWIYQSGVSATFQATPIVVDGVMYLSLPYNHVVAVDARTGRQIWRYEHKRKTEKMCCGPGNRGVAVAYGKVFFGTVDARLIALDQKTGKSLWDIPLAGDVAAKSESLDMLPANDPLRKTKVSGQTGVGANMAPIVYKGKVIVGITGVGYGLHLDADRPGAPTEAVVGFAGESLRSGFYAAFDAATGNRLWQFDTTAPTGWEGEFRTATLDGAPLDRDIDRERASFAKYEDSWKRGGGSAWTTPALDTERGLLFVGTGNPAPQMEDATRPGDNLYTVSLVALDVETGKLRWYHQQVPHDMWGLDVASPPVLFDVPIDGATVPAVGEAGKTGWFYVHDRRDGKLLYKSEPFVPQHNLFKRPTPEGVTIAPGAAGGANWSPVSFDARTGLVYVAALHMPSRFKVHELPADGDKPLLRYTSLELGGSESWGTLTAIDTRDRGKIRWQVKTDVPLIGGVLSTAGDLVFTGEGNGNLSAFDSETGERLWQFNCGAGVNAPPITFELDGVQYVSVAAGGNALFGFRQGDSVVTFALPK